MLGLLPEILKGITKKGYKQPTPIQRKAIPLIFNGDDVVAMVHCPILSIEIWNPLGTNR